MKLPLPRFVISSYRGRVWVVILSLIAALAMIGAAVQFVRLLDTDRDMNAIIREDAIWAVFQADRHMREFDRLAYLIADTGRLDLHADLVRHYDILYSRVTLLERGAFHLDLAASGEMTQNARALTDLVLSLEQTIDDLDPRQSGYWQNVISLSEKVAPFPALTNTLLLNANAAMNAQRVAERAARAAIREQLATMLIVLILAFVGIYALLMLQLRQLAATGRKMALLQKRSDRRAVRAQAASQAKTAFLATMSHEMRTPLNGIIGNAELIFLEDRAAPPDRKLNTILASAILLRDLIDGVLDFSRMDTRGITVKPGPVALKDLSGALQMTFSEEAARRGLSLHVTMPDDVVVTDESLLRQILAKLINNALKFSAQGAIKVTACRPSDTLLHIDVTDQGIGILAKDLPRLYEQFSQLDPSHARSFSGSGMGLAICKRMVDALGGRIGVDSTVGKGSRFWVDLPVTLAEIDITPDADDTAAGDGPGLDVLIVEDNPINADVLSAHLTHLGHRSHRAESGEIALAHLAQAQPDLVLMDVQMPGMDGLEATRRIRASGYQAPIIGVTANAFERDRAACLDAGMTDFLPKPITRAALAAVLVQHQDAWAHLAPAQPQPAMPQTTVPSESPAPSALSGQFRDLIETLGTEMACSFLDRFETEIAEVEAGLISGIAEADKKRQDDILHTFKGAALTLGLQTSGNFAQEMRSRLPVFSEDVDRLIALARADVAQCRVGVAASLRVELHE